MGAMTTDPVSEKPAHPTRKWIIATVALLVALVGVGAWALSLRSDVDDKDAQIAAQQQELEEQQGVADQVQEAASGFTEDAQQAFSELGDQLDQAQTEAAATQEETQAAIESAEQAAADAKAQADSAEDEVEEANARADEATAQAEAVGACARGYLSAIGGVFDAASISEGVTQAQSDIEALNASCLEKLGS
jgi:chromosome segregation ATPase